MKVKVIDVKSSKISSEEVKTKVTIDVEAKLPLMSKVINWQLSRRRAGSAHTKEMSEISGTTAKPFKQKGTGNARQGSKRSVQMRGGRTCFGPKARSFDFALPKKQRKDALQVALADKIKANSVVILDNSDVKELKTKELAKQFKDCEVKSALIITNGDSSVKKAANNLKGFKTLDIKALNPYDIVRHESLVLSRDNLKDVIGA